MGGSQLKRLKASLREQGLVGPQTSKKQKKKLSQDGKVTAEKRLQRQTALENIRDQFNPFQFKMSAKGPKFQVTTNKPQPSIGIKGRPGVLASQSEQRRRETLLTDLERRNKVGGILDRRFGEADPDMTPEEKALERFAREKQRAHKKNSLFDLEDDEADFNLTHLGKAITDEEDLLRDDFDPADLPSDDEDFAQIDSKRLKRMRGLDLDDDDALENDMPERKKSKQEVMKELIAKSKMHKYERQAAKDADDDLRAEIDKELPQLQELLIAKKPIFADAAKKVSGPEKIAGEDRAVFEKAFDVRLKQLLNDKRAQPSERTKTEDEIAEQQAERLKELEEKRLRRMNGQPDTDDSDEDDGSDEADEVDRSEDYFKGKDINPDAEIGDDFGLGRGIQSKLGPRLVEEEDDFFIEDDLIASGSEFEIDDDQSVEESDDEAASVADEDEEDDFTKGLLAEGESKELFTMDTSSTQVKDGEIPYTFPCPSSLSELLETLQQRKIHISRLPTVIQRIRALYHPKLGEQNRALLVAFAPVLVDLIHHLGTIAKPEIYATLEAVIRHTHSLAKMLPIEVASAFRAHVRTMVTTRPLELNSGDLAILTAAGTIFSASDHYHQVVLPANLVAARYLGQKIPKTLPEYATGTYLCIVLLQNQQLAKRYVPEVINFSLNTLCALSPSAPKEKMGNFPVHPPPAGIRIRSATGIQPRKLTWEDCKVSDDKQGAAVANLAVAILHTTIAVLSAAAQTWTGKSAFFETFQPCAQVLGHLKEANCASHLSKSVNASIKELLASLSRMLDVAKLSRRPLELHHHRPLAIKTYIPKFEENYNIDKHYDPNKERSDAAKLRAEHKKERKGAMRELRKDAAFMSREKLRLKKTKDAAYEKKYKRLVAEIQGEEGREANEYEREKKLRKRSRNK